MIMDDNKLFIVEFGDPNTTNAFPFGGRCAIKPIYVIAKDYSGASGKGMLFLQKYLETDKSTIFDNDGSLANTKPEEVTIVAVKLLSDTIIY